MTIRAGMDGPTWGPDREVLPGRKTSYDPRTEVSVGKRLFFIGLIASLSATAFIAILTLLLGEFDETGGRILLTTALLSGFSLFALPAGSLLDQRRAVLLAYAVLALSALAFVVAMTLVWGSWDDDNDHERQWKTLAVLASFAAAGAQIAATTSRRRADDSDAVRWLYGTSVALALLFAVLVSVAAINEIDDEGFYRALGAVTVADVLLVIVQSVARRLRPGGPAAAAAPGGSHTLRIHVDGTPAELPAGYTASGQAVECTVPGSDFADAVARAIRTREQAGLRVERIERAG
jgi:hypothetical protein